MMQHGWGMTVRVVHRTSSQPGTLFQIVHDEEDDVDQLVERVNVPAHILAVQMTRIHAMVSDQVAVHERNNRYTAEYEHRWLMIVHHHKQSLNLVRRWVEKLYRKVHDEKQI